MVRELKYYVGQTLVTAFILFAVYDLRHSDFRVPLYYSIGGDLNGYMTGFKTLHETGWVHVNPRLGAPGVMDFYDFPAIAYLVVGTVKVLTAVCGGPHFAANLFLLLGFFLSGWSGLFVLRQFGICGAVASAGGLLFAFQPLHFFRSAIHPDLGFYPVIPLGILLCLWLCEEKPLFFVSGAGETAKRSPRRAVAALVILALAASSTIYYAWFMGFFLVVSGMIVWLRRPRLALPGDALLCVLLFLGAVIFQAIPIVVHRMTHEVAPKALQRSPGSSQVFGLAVAELMLPTLGHRVPQLRVVEARQTIGHGLDPKAPGIGQRVLLNEKYYNALGVVGAVGFVILCLVPLAAETPWVARSKPISDLAKLNFAAILLGSGFALLVEIVFPLIRSYNRIAIYISFLSLFAIALIVEKLRPGDDSSFRSRMVFLAVVVTVTAAGLLDEIPGVVTPDHHMAAEAFARDAEYVQKLEDMLEPEAMVFQLPYVPYPEGGTYEPFKPYLHSKTLHWSFGASRGMKNDLWQKSVAGQPLSEMVAELKRAKFAGIHVDFDILKEIGPALRADLDRALGPPALSGNNGQWAFYPLPATP
jgi:phosphoglycerol transferase